MCTCRGCYLLFTAEDAHAALPRRARPLPVVPRLRPRPRPAGTSWRSRSGSRSSSATRCSDRMVAFYPGPAGATESELPLDAWDGRRGGQPGAATAAARRRGAAGPRARTTSSASSSCHLVPIDACYELVGRLRQVWRGFDGGQEARGRARRVLRRGVGAQPAAPSAEAGADDRPRVHGPRHRRRAVRRRAAADRPAADRGDHRRAGARDRAALPGADRAAAPRATTTPRRQGLRDLFGDRGPLVRHPQAVPVDAVRRPWCRASPASTEVDLPLPCTYDFEVTGSQVPARAARRRRAAGAAVLRHRLHPRRDRVRRRAGAVGPRGALPAAGRGLAADDGPATSPDTGWLRLDRDVARRARRLPGRSAA